MKWLEEENLTVKTCSYTDLLSYAKQLKDRGMSVHTLNCYLRNIKYYYQYLQERNEIEKNPASRLKIKGAIEKLPEDLLSKKELNTIYVNYQTETAVQKRNKILLGLAIYQGMRLDELEAMEPADIDLHQGKVYIRQVGRARRRTLKLEAHQILPLQDYIENALPEIREKANKESEKLIMSTGKSSGIKELICDLNKTLRKHYPRYKNLQQLRSSRISLWVEEKNIIEAQYMAGHRSIRSTERYKKVNMKELKEALDKYHPIASAQSHL